jgi:hypothetical protein
LTCCPEDGRPVRRGSYLTSCLLLRCRPSSVLLSFSFSSPHSPPLSSLQPLTLHLTQFQTQPLDPTPTPASNTITYPPYEPTTDPTYDPTFDSPTDPTIYPASDTITESLFDSASTPDPISDTTTDPTYAPITTDPTTASAVDPPTNTPRDSSFFDPHPS